MNDCDWDPARVYRSEIRKAARAHPCCECGGTIAKGERHEYVTGCWDGDWSSFRTCPDCIPIRCEVANMEGGCGGWLHAGMLEELENMKYQPGNARIIAAYNASVAHRGGSQVYMIEDDEPEKEQP